MLTVFASLIIRLSPAGAHRHTLVPAVAAVCVLRGPLYWLGPLQFSGTWSAVGLPQILQACGATKYHLLLEFLTATPAVLFLCPVSMVGKSVCMPRPFPLPDRLVGGAGTLGGKPRGEKGSLAAMSCATSCLFVATSSSLVLVNVVMVVAWLSMVSALTTAACQRVKRSGHLCCDVVSRLLLRGFLGVACGDGGVGLVIRFYSQVLVLLFDGA